MDTPRLLEAGPCEMRLVADAFEGQLDLRAFRAACPQYPVLCASPLVVELERGRWACLEKFGAVVVWNPTEALLATLHAELRALPGVGRPVERARDDLRVAVGAPEDRVGFAEVALRALSLDALKLLSLALARSVALEAVELAVREPLARMQPVVRGLRERGRLGLSHREAVKLVGFTLEVRAAVLEDLTLLDDPPETWESEALDRLDAALWEAFDLEERLAAVQQKLAYLAEAAARLGELLATRKSHRLEWIVIALIAVEIVQTLWKDVLLPRLLP